MITMVVVELDTEGVHGMLVDIIQFTKIIVKHLFKRIPLLFICGLELHNQFSLQKNDINEVLDELNPDYKNDLMDRYLDEMPEELANLMKKYRKINFTKSMYMNYLENKNKNIPGETPLDKMNIEN